MTKSEAQTRSKLIDKQLALSGWNVKDTTQAFEEFDILTALPEGIADPRTPYESRQFSDYVLLGKDGRPLAVVEAKKSSKDAAIGREQAKQYCYKIVGHKNRYQRSLIKLGTLYGTSGQQAFKGELNLLRVLLSTESKQ